jgi:hypothetical protein
LLLVDLKIDSLDLERLGAIAVGERLAEVVAVAGVGGALAGVEEEAVEEAVVLPVPFR